MTIDGAWGSRQADGSFNGIIGMLERQEVEMGVASFSLQKSRSEAADHLFPFIMTRHNLYVKTAGNAGSTMTAYVKPFHITLWSAIVAFGVVSGLIFGFMSFLKGDKCPFGQAIMIQVHGLLSQGYHEDPKDCSRRIAFLMTFIVGQIGILTYSACLMSFLAIKEKSLPFHDMKSLYHQTNYRVLLLSGSSYIENFKVLGYVLKSFNCKNISSRTGVTLPKEYLRKEFHMEQTWTACRMHCIPGPI